MKFPTKKNKIHIIFFSITIICIFSVASIADQCGCRDILEEETKKAEEKLVKERPTETPTITLEIYEGPIYSSSGICYYRIEAIVTGNPTPEVHFSRDDSNGGCGSYRTQVNLYDKNDSCLLSADAVNPEGTATDTIKLYWECEADKDPDLQPDFIEYNVAFGIDYANPGKYLVQGEQSKISDSQTIEKVYSEKKGMDHLCSIYNWLNTDFSSFTASGGHIGTVTVDQLLNDRRLGGCHDYALVYSAVARHYGYPAIMLETASIYWIKQFREDRENASLHKGHVFVEVYLDNNWILIDPTSGWHVKDNYNPAEPVIPLDKESSGQPKKIYGYYAYLKGLDSWAMDIYSNSDTKKAMDETAIKVEPDNIQYPDYEFDRFVQ